MPAITVVIDFKSSSLLEILGKIVENEGNYHNNQLILSV